MTRSRHARPQETNIIRRVRPWEAEFTKPYNRGLLIDCEGGETIIARTDTSAEQEEWADALRTVTELLGNTAMTGFGSGDSDDGDGDDGFGLDGRAMQTTYLKQKEALLTPAEATGPCTVVFQVRSRDRRGGGGGSKAWRWWVTYFFNHARIFVCQRRV